MVEMRVNMLAQRLTLTDAQKAQATTIFTQAANQTQSIHDSLRTIMNTVQTAVKSNDTATIDQQSVTYGTLSGQLMGIERKADAAFYAILTADQKTKFDARGPGGMMGPGGGFGGPRGQMRGPRPSQQ